jgi:hypothetical protein
MVSPILSPFLRTYEQQWLRLISECQALQKPLALYNQWPYRCADETLTESLFKIELADFPIFWEQFLKHLPSLKKVMRTDSLNAMRELSEENAPATGAPTKNFRFLQ